MFIFKKIIYLWKLEVCVNKFKFILTNKNKLLVVNEVILKTIIKRFTSFRKTLTLDIKHSLKEITSMVIVVGKT